MPTEDSETLRRARAAHCGAVTRGGSARAAEHFSDGDERARAGGEGVPAVCEAGLQGCEIEPT